MNGIRASGLVMTMLLLAACGSEERSRRRAESLPQTSVEPANDDAGPRTDDSRPSADDEASQAALAKCEESASYVCYVEVAIISHTNAMRVEAGLEPYVFATKLSYAARRWSQAQADAGAISHDGFPLAREAVIAEAFGEDHGAKVLGENVAQNMMQQNAESTGRALVTQWWNSPSHKQNILGDFPAIGVGVGLRGSKTYATQLFGREAAD